MQVSRLGCEFETCESEHRIELCAGEVAPGTRGAGTRGASNAAQLLLAYGVDGHRPPDAVASGSLRFPRHSE